MEQQYLFSMDERIPPLPVAGKPRVSRWRGPVTTCDACISDLVRPAGRRVDQAPGKWTYRTHEGFPALLCENHMAELAQRQKKGYQRHGTSDRPRHDEDDRRAL